MDNKQSAVSTKWAVATLGVVVLVIGASIAVLSLRPEKKVSNFEECRASGGALLETYPEQCRLGGVSYTNEAQQPPERPLPAGDDDYVGLSEDDALAKAEKLNTPARVVERDGEGLPATMDFVYGRHNLYVRDGLVYKVDIEGQAVGN